MAACHGLFCTLTPQALARRLDALRADHPLWDKAVWFSAAVPVLAAQESPLPGARSQAGYCFRKDPDLFGVFARDIPRALYAAFTADQLVLVDEDGSGLPIPRRP